MVLGGGASSDRSDGDGTRWCAGGCADAVVSGGICRGKIKQDRQG